MLVLTVIKYSYPRSNGITWKRTYAVIRFFISMIFIHKQKNNFNKVTLFFFFFVTKNLTTYLYSSLDLILDSFPSWGLFVNDGRLRVYCFKWWHLFSHLILKIIKLIFYHLYPFFICHLSMTMQNRNFSSLDSETLDGNNNRIFLLKPKNVYFLSILNFIVILRWILFSVLSVYFYI